MLYLSLSPSSLNTEIAALNLLNVYEYFCLDHISCATDDQYLLFHFKAIEAADIHSNINKAIQLEKNIVITEYNSIILKFTIDLR